jgi:hypothetical protein
MCNAMLLDFHIMFLLDGAVLLDGEELVVHIRGFAVDIRT